MTCTWTGFMAVLCWPRSLLRWESLSQAPFRPIGRAFPKRSRLNGRNQLEQCVLLDPGTCWHSLFFFYALYETLKHGHASPLKVTPACKQSLYVCICVHTIFTYRHVLHVHMKLSTVHLWCQLCTKRNVIMCPN